VVIFLLDEDRVYLSWLAHHRNGFVLDWLRKPTKKTPMIHRAACAEIKTAKTKNTHWTTGRHVKVCSLDRDELVSWAKDESDGNPDDCELCKPADDTAAVTSASDRHLTKLGEEIIDYIVEAAVIHLDRQDSGYELTVGDVAQCLDKTPGQIPPALHRLAEDGYVRLNRAAEIGTSLPDRCEVFPTADAMRLLPAFEKMSQRQVQAELENLTEGE
jgi:hypothetical protein